MMKLLGLRVLILIVGAALAAGGFGYIFGTSEDAIGAAIVAFVLIGTVGVSVLIRTRYTVIDRSPPLRLVRGVFIGAVLSLALAIGGVALSASSGHELAVVILSALVLLSVGVIAIATRSLRGDD